MSDRATQGAWDYFRAPGFWALFGVLVAMAAAGLCGADGLVKQALQAHTPIWAYETARFLGRCGQSEKYIIPAVLMLLWWWRVRPNARLRWACVWLLATLAASGIVTRILKIGFGRYRPKHGDGGFTFFTLDAKLNSFPSGHSSDAVALATVLWFVYPPLRPLYVAWAVLIVTARMVSLDHYVADVATGALVGLVCAFVLRRWLDPSCGRSTSQL